MDLCSLREIRALLDRHGFRFSKKLGQNFLIAPWVPMEIAVAAKIDDTCGVLEIGPGVGCLTVQLARIAGKVASVELDRALLPVLAETLRDTPNATVIHGDILQTDLAALVAEHFSGLRPVVCANLPYQITTPILTRFLESGLFSNITVMVQREVARRIAAQPGTADYGAFSVFAAYHAKANLLFDVPPECFYPAPRVHSSVIELRPYATPPITTPRAPLFRIVKAAFSQRRKTLVNCLSAALPAVPKADFAKILDGLGHNPNIRGETLSLQAFAALTDTLIKRGILLCD